MTTTPSTIDTPAADLVEGDRIFGNGLTATVLGVKYGRDRRVWVSLQDETGARYADFHAPDRTFRRIAPPNPFAVYGPQPIAVTLAIRSRIAQLVEAAGAESLRGNHAAVNEAAYLIAETVGHLYPGSGASDTMTRDAIYEAIVEAVGPAPESAAAADLPEGWTPPAGLVAELRRLTARRRPLVKTGSGTWTRP